MADNDVLTCAYCGEDVNKDEAQWDDGDPFCSDDCVWASYEADE